MCSEGAPEARRLQESRPTRLEGWVPLVQTSCVAAERSLVSKSWCADFCWRALATATCRGHELRGNLRALARGSSTRCGSRRCRLWGSQRAAGCVRCCGVTVCLRHGLGCGRGDQGLVPPPAPVQEPGRAHVPQRGSASMFQSEAS